MASNQQKLTDKQTKEINKLRNELGTLELDCDVLFKLFDEWQSLKTRSLKRFTITLSFILTLGLVTGTDIMTAKPLGIEFTGEDPTCFLIVLLIVHVGVFIYFLYQRLVDSNVRKTRLKLSIKEFYKNKNLKSSVYKVIDEVAVNDLSELLSLANASTLNKFDRMAIKTFDTIIFYEDNLEQQRKKAEVGEVIETIIIGFIAVLGAIFIFLSFP